MTPTKPCPGRSPTDRIPCELKAGHLGSCQRGDLSWWYASGFESNVIVANLKDGLPRPAGKKGKR